MIQVFGLGLQAEFVALAADDGGFCAHAVILTRLVKYATLSPASPRAYIPHLKEEVLRRFWIKNISINIYKYSTHSAAVHY